MKFGKKAVCIGISVSLTVCMTIVLVFSVLKKPETSDRTVENDTSKSDVNIITPEKASNDTAATEYENKTNPGITIDVGTETSSSSNKPNLSDGKESQGTKTVAKNTTTAVKDNPKVTSPSKTYPGGVINVTPIERPGEPSGPSGVKPKSTDWIYINPDIPAELYNYDYTVIEGEEILTGKQIQYRGFMDWDKAAEAAGGALTTYYTVDYRNIGSTNTNDKAEYLRSLVYWVGESSQYDICEYMQLVKDNKIISRASVITDGSLIYNNGVRLIRARVFVTFESGAAYYGLKNGIKYYKDVEVAVYPSTGEDRYGYGKSSDYQALLFSKDCFNTLCDFKKA